MRNAVMAVALTALLPCHLALGQSISKESAVVLAEKFVAENGYTNLPAENVKPELDPESIEWNTTREKILEFRFNTLKPRAIGIKREHRNGPDGWSVAFDYTSPPPVEPGICRVVTMKEDGSDLHMQHKAGIRTYFTGFD
jgi:hypothetical protein